MTNCKWLRRALLGGVAISVMSTGAMADDLGDLKAQIEALQARVNSLESTPTVGALPEGASLITFQRGQGTLGDWNVDRASEGEMPSDRGFTIAVTPTADVPAPITEVTVSGYVKADFIWDFNQDLGQTFDPTAIDDRDQNDVHFQAHARQTRFRIKSKTDTAIGQIRTLIEGDFWGSGQGDRGSFRLRHAYGEWDMTPNWTLGIGRYWGLGADLITGVPLVDFGASIGGAYSRAEQVRLQYQSGPITFAMGIQDPKRSVRDAVVFKSTGVFLATVTGATFVDTPDLPAFGAHLIYDAPGGHQLFLGANVQQHQLDRDVNGIGRSKVGWHVSAGANINLADMATLTGHISFADGLTSHMAFANGSDSVIVADFGTGSVKLRNNRALGGYVGLSFDLTDTVQANAQWGFLDPQGSHAKDAGVNFTHMHTVHGNIMWRPVRQMRLGWEVMYGRKTYGTRYLAANPTAKKNNDAIRGQFGAWFFF